MKYQIINMNASLEEDYLALLEQSPSAMFNHSIKYRNFLRKILPNSNDKYFLAYKDDKLIAALPTFSQNGSLGLVVNSLPFYGSHGGAIIGIGQDKNVRSALLSAFNNYCKDIGAILSTLIESPFDEERNLNTILQANYHDIRIGQITELPNGNQEDVAEKLLEVYHQKTRNIVRKGIGGGFNVIHDGAPYAFENLYTMHRDNMQAIGGIEKPLKVFDAIQNIFTYNADYRIYMAIKNDMVAASLLVFYFKDIVEYFIPVTNEKFKVQQPLSLLIFEAMKDAIIERRSKYWNWGGTWESQHGVYHFKSRWGTKNTIYKYYITKYNQHLDPKKLSKSELISNYPFFYTLPFSEVGYE